MYIWRDAKKEVTVFMDPLQHFFDRSFVLAGIVCTIIHSKESFVSLDTGREEEKKDDDKKPSTFKTIANEAMRVRERMVDKTKARYKKFCRDNNI